LLIPGFSNARGVFLSLAENLWGAGFPIVSFPTGGSLNPYFFQRVDHEAVRIKKLLDDLRRRERFEQVDIVGYSFGGVVAHYLVRCLNLRYARRVITLASPLNGARLALPVLLSPAFPVARQMLPGSEFLRRLSGAPLPGHVYFHSFYSRSDWLCPPKYARVSATEKAKVENFEFQRLGHADFLWHPIVAQMVLDRLAQTI